MAVFQNAHDGEELASLANSSATAVKARGGQSGAYVSLTGAAIGEPGFDMPVVNKKYSGQHYRYVYGTGGYDQGYFKNAVSLSLWRNTGRQSMRADVFFSNE